jgi:hypothetical protein
VSSVRSQLASTSVANGPRSSDRIAFPIHAIVTGLLTGLLLLISVISIAGPVANDTPNQMAASLYEKRSMILVALFGVGLAAMLGIWTVSVLRSWLSRVVADDGEQLVGAAFAGAVLAMAMLLVGFALFYGATYKLAGHGGSGALVGLVDAANGAMMMSKFGLAAFVAAVSAAAARSDRFPGWFSTFGYLAAAALVGSSIGLFTHDSFTQFGGPLDLGGAVPAGIWGALLMGRLYGERTSTTAAQ